MYPTINTPLFASLDLFYFLTVLDYFYSLTNYVFRSIKFETLNNISTAKNNLKVGNDLL